MTFATGTTEEPQGARAWLAPGSFLQASAEGARLIASTVLAALGEALGPLAGVAVLELHAGNGTLTLPLASQGARVTAVESDARSAAGLAESAARAGVPVEVLAADAARETARLAASGRRFRAVVLDPPRTGAREAVAGIAALAPEAIVHVSCDAATFARDAGALVAAGFVLRHVRPLLLFPQTAHFETVALFERGGQGGA